MSVRPGHDLGNLIKWTARDEWRGRVDAVMAEHFEPTMEAFGLGFEEIDDALGGGWAMTLWGCAFEDFLTRHFGPDGENPVEAYLRRRGWGSTKICGGGCIRLPRGVSRRPCRWQRCRGTTWRRRRGGCRRAFWSGFAGAGERPSASTASAGAWRSACRLRG